MGAMVPEVSFPWKAVVFAGAVAITAGAIALFCVLTLLSFMADDHVFIEFNGHVVGGRPTRLSPPYSPFSSARSLSLRCLLVADLSRSVTS
jgi:hypothetical protein